MLVVFTRARQRSLVASRFVGFVFAFCIRSATVFADSVELDSTQTGPRDAQSDSADTPSDVSANPLSLGPLQLALFVDTYAAWQTSGNGTLATLSEHRAFTGQGATMRAENGLGLSFLGFDIQYDAGSFGVVANLRFGEGAMLFHNDNDATYGVQFLTQAYALYRPIEQLEIDLGMFLSPFGVESLESFKNLNYTISALYTYGQPNWHMGLRATYELSESLTFMALVVNGANNISETQQLDGFDQAPTVGGSVTYRVNPALSLALGGMWALDGYHNDDDGYDGFADFVGTLELGALTTWVNLDYIFTRNGAPNGSNRNFIGGSLTSGYRFNDIVGVALRGEYLRDNANFDGHDLWQLFTGTVTLDVEPIPGKPYLIVRWENRWEKSNQRVFGEDSHGTADPADDSYSRTWFESVLGVVVTTSP